jgi:DNA polymerase III delta prime subunit
VLGDPGTGKSVAMRKLARDLIAESGRSARIPIYVNLKEWRRQKSWTAEDKPTAEEFYKFLFYSVLENLDYASRALLQDNENYHRLFEAGYFFFILDSFDEIPAVLDHDENSWLIGELSAAITRCVLGGHNSRAVIASRLFRKPKIIAESRSIFEIRPFSDDRIVRAISAAASDSERLIKIVLTERPDLGALGRNPFLLNLVINHFNLRHEAPNSQAQMFETFFQSNIDFARAQYEFVDVSDSDIYLTCEQIAQSMFSQSNVRLELSDVELKRDIQREDLPEVLRFLVQARIARLGSASGNFSFVHRRFNEYFLVRRLAQGGHAVPYDAIQADSRWRDALVLYAEIASAEDAKKLADHAWSNVCQLGRLSLRENFSEFIRARHALRFMVEAFRSRLEVISPFQDSLGAIVEAKLRDTSDFIEKKTVAEAVGLLQAEKSGTLIEYVVSKYPGWISESAAASARYLPRIRQDLGLALFDNIVGQPGFRAVRDAARQQDVFALSSAFKNVVTWLKCFRLDIYKSWIVLIVLAVIAAQLASNAGTLKLVCFSVRPVWPAPGSADTELGVLMDLEVGHGETKIYAGVQA